jgi:2-desacetyl-2-hydroxyethyl bacteriochlorophyllide A dehydrogenase
MATRLHFAGPRTVGYENVDLKPLAEDEVLIQTHYSGISAGTEMGYYRGTGPELAGCWDWATRTFNPDQPPSFKYPLAYGYENVGVVQEVGAKASNVRPGDCVFSYGCHETHTVQKADAVWKLPAGVSPRAANMLAVLRLCFNGVLAADLHLGETVLVFGLGVLGQLTAQLARLSGARVIGIDLVQRRLDLAQRLGCDLVLSPAQGNLPLRIRELTGGLGADCAFELTASERGLESAVRCVAPHSKVMAMSFYQGAAPLKMPPEFHYNCIRVQVSQAMQVPVELRHRWTPARICETTAALLPQLRLDDLVSHELAFESAAEAYRLVDQNPQDALQVVLRYPAARTS